MIFENRYGFIDRILHQMAFSGGRAQQALAEIEDLLFRDELESPPSTSPIFISGLPRSGTTILLDVLFRTGSFACHIYRDMPFVLCPMLWSRFSKRFSVGSSPRERAHGDGLTVSGDHPEAFEEMIWKHFWKEHYQEDRILPWDSSDQNREFASFMERHMKKIVAIRGKDKNSSRLRYLSKNNASVARLCSPPPPLDRGMFLIPFREPLQQAASMHRQHRRFLEIQEDDAFVYRYMEGIGHHEFGLGLRPIDFAGWLSEAASPTTLEFWLQYWVAAYRHVLDHSAPSVILVSYDRLTGRPEDALGRLEKVLGIPPGSVSSQANRICPPRTHRTKAAQISPELVESASILYGRLRKKADV